jgi:hypothetical protein
MRHLAPFALVIASACTTYLPPDAVDEAGNRVEQSIVGGSDAPAGLYRYQVSIQTRWGDHFCGGSIIADGWVLTAAHCVQGEQASNLRVEADILRLSEAGPAFDVSRIVIHPSYSSATSNNDIALLQLTRSTGAVPPIALMTAAAEPTLAAPGLPLTVTGWGTLSSGSSTLPDRLQQVDVSIISRTSCQSSYPSENISSGMLCAGSPGRDSCQGDSGGPAVVDGGEEPVLTGVVSWGYGCANPRYPGVYARVANYADWIRSYVPNVRFVGQPGGGGGGSAPPPPPSGDDHGDSPSSATQVNGTGVVTVQGVLGAGDRDVFRIDLPAAGRLTAATTGSIDTYGTLTNPSGAVLARDDDSGAGTNFSLAADASGTVYLEVRGYDARAAGPYTLTLTVPAGAPETDAPESTADFVLDLRSTASSQVVISDFLAAGTRVTYTVEVLSPATATLTAGTTSAIDTFGTLYAANGGVLATDDDTGPSLNFSVAQAVSPGVYSVEVRGYNGTTTGNYDLTLSARR